MSKSSSSSVSTMDDESDWWKSHDSVSQDQEDGLHDTLPLSNSFSPDKPTSIEQCTVGSHTDVGEFWPTPPLSPAKV